MGTNGPTGSIFLPEDLAVLKEQGHELGCHTYEHCHSWDTSAAAFENSIVKNRNALSKLFPGASFKTMSYPISPPRPRTKRIVSQRFVCCRGGGQTFNVGTVDLGYLAAFFMEQGRDRPDMLKKLIEENREARGWLIFATHDVCDSPTPFGVTPDFFEDIVRSAVDSSALILPVLQAWETLHREAMLGPLPANENEPG
jgi:peptidoglycan/xylan/chitin deacetylase (PgdA/CDA1 family)